MPKRASNRVDFFRGGRVCKGTTEYLDKCRHTQTRVSGVNCRTKEKFDLYCDCAISYLITRLNEIGIHTCYSCQGGGNDGYICFLPAPAKYMSMAYYLIKDQLKNYWLKMELDAMGRIVVRFYSQLPDKAEKILYKGNF